MRRQLVNGVIAAALVTTGLAAWVGAQGQRASPHEKTEATVDGAKVSIEYGRPYMKGRKIFGGLVPYGQVWRTGADEATTLVTDQALVFGTVMVPAGTYTLYTIPGEKEWTLIVNKQTGQWGTQYSEAQDLGRISMKVSRLDSPAEQLTISVADTASGGEAHFDWESTRASAPFTVKK
jgi:hypothetical protein